MTTYKHQISCYAFAVIQLSIRENLYLWSINRYILSNWKFVKLGKELKQLYLCVLKISWTLYNNWKIILNFFATLQIKLLFNISDKWLNKPYAKFIQRRFLLLTWIEREWRPAAKDSFSFSSSESCDWFNWLWLDWLLLARRLSFLVRFDLWWYFFSLLIGALGWFFGCPTMKNKNNLNTQKINVFISHISNIVHNKLITFT